MAKCPRRSRARAAHHGRGLSRRSSTRLVARGLDAPRAPVQGVEAAPAPDHPALRDHLMPRTVHVIGAGLAGLAAAVRLADAGERVVVHEATAAGGRPLPLLLRSRRLDLVIDNGNHLLLSGNHAALAYRAARIGAASRAGRSAAGGFRLHRSGDRRALDLADQRRPSAVVDVRRRAAACRARRAMRLSRACAAAAGPARTRPSATVIACTGPVYDRLVGIRCCSRRSTPTRRRARRRSRRAIIRETLLAGGTRLPAADRARRPEPTC